MGPQPRPHGRGPLPDSGCLPSALRPCLSTPTSGRLPEALGSCSRFSNSVLQGSRQKCLLNAKVENVQIYCFEISVCLLGLVDAVPSKFQSVLFKKENF